MMDQDVPLQAWKDEAALIFDQTVCHMQAYLEFCPPMEEASESQKASMAIETITQLLARGVPKEAINESIIRSNLLYFGQQTLEQPTN